MEAEVKYFQRKISFIKCNYKKIYLQIFFVIGRNGWTLLSSIIHFSYIYKTENVSEYEWCKKDNKHLLVSDRSKIECEDIYI